MSNIVDITYAVSPEEAQGRRRMKNMETGDVFWVDELVVDYDEFEVKPMGDVVVKIDDLCPSPKDYVILKPKGKKRGA